MKRALSSAIAASIATATIALGAGNPTMAATPGPWSDYRSADFATAAGERCEFPLSQTVLEDQEQIRTLSTYPDGSPKTMEVVGRLVAEYRNDFTGDSVVRNLTGTAVFGVRPDGTLSYIDLLGGHMAVGLRAADPDGPAFLVFTGGGHSVSFSENGTRTVDYGPGPVEDICETLA